MEQAEINIELDTVARNRALQSLQSHRISPMAYRLHRPEQSHAVLVARVAAGSVNELLGGLYATSLDIRQDCIAVRHPSGWGELVGPTTAPYGGEFKSQYFVRF